MPDSAPSYDHEYAAHEQHIQFTESHSGNLELDAVPVLHVMAKDLMEPLIPLMPEASAPYVQAHALLILVTATTLLFLVSIGTNSCSHVPVHTSHGCTDTYADTAVETTVVTDNGCLLAITAGIVAMIAIAPSPRSPPRALQCYDCLWDWIPQFKVSGMYSYHQGSAEQLQAQDRGAVWSHGGGQNNTAAYLGRRCSTTRHSLLDEAD